MKSMMNWAGFATILAIAAAAPASAQSFADAGLANATYTIPSSGGWTVAISGCTGTGTLCSADTLTGTVAGSQLSLVFTGTNNGNDFLYSSGAGQVDLSVTLAVTAPTGQTIYYASDALSASSTTTAAAGVIAATETLTGPTEPTLKSALGVSPLLQSDIFRPVITAVTASMDIVAGLGLSKVTTIPSLTLTFNTPEPVSTSLLAVGLAGLGFVRRKRRSV